MAPLAVPALLASLGGFPAAPDVSIDGAVTALWRVAALGAALLVAAGLLAALRRRLLRGRVTAEAATWGCGYTATSPRMQYTGSSFAQPLTELFAPLLRGRSSVEPPAGCFPAGASLETVTPDLVSRRVYEPLFDRLSATLASLRWFQQGHTRLYVAYIAATLLALLLWKLR
jgi:hydrogenase-4 component B